MASQALGSLVAAAGILWFLFTLTLDRAAPQQAVVSLWGVVGFVGGLVLWALGRVEVAVAPSEEQGKRGGVLAILPFLVLLMALVMAAVFFFMGSSPREANQPIPQRLLRGDK
jgi:hypothetical protein